MYSVYVHVPFCEKRCGYCDFNTYTAYDLGEGASRDNYANLVCQELEATHRFQLAHGINEPAVSSIFFGGGTPTLLPARDLVRIVECINDLWGIEQGAEITTEANPDTVDFGYLQDLKVGGFTRVSFGMQSAVSHVLSTLDRTHTPENVSRGVRSAQKLGLDASVDLIYGTPGESLEDWRTSVRAALALDVQHISAYALTIEPHTPMGQRIARGTLPRPDDDDEAAKYEIADELFTQAGLQWYEVSNWAVPGHESRHNLGYWHNIDWAGVGPGAHSHYNRVAGLSQRHDDPALTRGALAGFRKAGTLGEPIEPAESTVTTDTIGIAGSVGSAESGNPIESVAMHSTSQNPNATGENETNTAGTVALRAWDIAHPKLWAHSLSQGLMPWSGRESIDETAALEEHIMLGLRLKEGLDITTLPQSDALEALADKLVAEGLLTRNTTQLVPTLRGRMLNDTIIQEIFTLLLPVDEEE